MHAELPSGYTDHALEAFYSMYLIYLATIQIREEAAELEDKMEFLSSV